MADRDPTRRTGGVPLSPEEIAEAKKAVTDAEDLGKLFEEAGLDAGTLKDIAKRGKAYLKLLERLQK